MKRGVVWLVAVLFALSLQGTALAQKEEKAPETMMPPQMESPAPAAPAENLLAPEKKTCKKKVAHKKTQKTCKKLVVKKKRCKVAKRVA